MRLFIRVTLVLSVFCGLCFAQSNVVVGFSDFRETVDVMGSGGDANSFTDSRDGKTYRIVEMPDGRTWMAENLNYRNPAWSHNDHVDSIPWGGGTFGSWCYGDVFSNCEKYGRLYTWDAAMDNACPAGWRLPTRQDWNDLVQAAGGNVAGTKLKASAPDWDGTDDFGFSALPGGYRLTNGGFYDVGSYGSWWSATESDGGNACNRGMTTDYAGVYEVWFNKGDGFSVRCLRE